MKNLKNDVFQFKNYKDYLLNRLAEGGARSGLRSGLAKAINIQSSYLSQVLHGKPDLTLEQAFQVNHFFNHDSSECEYFLLLVQKDRAGTMELKNYFQHQLTNLLLQRSKIKNRLSETTGLSQEVQAEYYSTWEYIAIHMVLSVPTLRTAASLEKYLQIPHENVEKILHFLTSAGLASFEGREYTVGKTHIHLGLDSKFINQHHTNWRLEALKRLTQLHRHSHLNYSAVFSISKEDYYRLRENLLKVIQDNLAIVKPSQDEMIVCQLIDLLPLGNQ